MAYCASATDIQRCVAFARTHGITPTPRSGGHSYGGYSTGTGLVIDVSRLNTVAADPMTMTAVIGSGTQLIDVYSSSRRGRDASCPPDRARRWASPG